MPRWTPQLARIAPLVLILFLVFTVNLARAQDTTTLPQGQVGKVYSVTIGIDTENGRGQFVWRLAHGDLPPGLQVVSTGKIEGTPTATKADPYLFDLTVSDSSQPPQSAVLIFSLVIAAAPLRIKAVSVATTQLKVLGVRAVGAGTGATVPSGTLPEVRATPNAVTAASGSAAPPVATPVADPPPGAQAPSSAADSPDKAAAAQGSTGAAAGTDNAGSNAKTVQATDANKEWEARAIVGYHQAGASSAKFTQNFFFDFFIMRALSSKHLWENKTWNLWGDVRIASAPQQITTGVGTFATNFATQVGNLPVNQLAQSADFQTGLERVMHNWTTTSGGNRSVGLIGYFGAMGAFEPPDSQMQIFNVPDKTSLQYPAFAAAFPSAANAKYVGFVPPNRERFYRNYGLGLRLATFDRDSPLAAPATYSLSFGEDEAITGGIFRSVVGKIDVFYPLPLSGASGKYKFVYLFGTANLRLSKANPIPTFALENPNANGTVVQPFDPNLAVVTVRSTRDTYRFGAGVDLINLIQSIAGKDQVTPPPANDAKKKPNQ